jgi:hypothetical protein
VRKDDDQSYNTTIQALMEFRTYSGAFQPSIQRTYENLGYSV